MEIINPPRSILDVLSLRLSYKDRKCLNYVPDDDRFWLQVDRIEDDKCWEWLGGRSSRYGHMRYKGKKIPVHRYSFYLHTGYMPLRFEYVCHSCDNIYCANPYHLFLGTQLDNMRDMMEKGRNPDTKGEKNGRCVLSIDDVRKIRGLRKEGCKYSDLVKMFSIGQTQIGRIVRNETWAWLE